MRTFFVRFVPEQTKNDPSLDQFLAISEDLNFKFSLVGSRLRSP